MERELQLREMATRYANKLRQRTADPTTDGFATVQTTRWALYLIQRAIQNGLDQPVDKG